MTDKDKVLSDFLQAHDPPARDAFFAARMAAALRRRRDAERLVLWSALAFAITLALAMAGPAITEPLTRLAPAIGPLAVVASVLFILRRAQLG